jgi:two-component system phosphate regulon response regulator PhoB
MARVLIVDFEDDARVTLSDALTARGHAVRIAALREAGVAMWTQRIPDVVVVDIATAENDAFDPWRALKQTKPTSSSKLIVLTRKAWRAAIEEIDAVFEKPFRVQEFCECVEALAHVRPLNDDTSIECGELTVHRRTGEALVHGEGVDLTLLERKLLVALYDRRPTPMSRGAILHTVWNMREDLETRTIDTHIRRLRVKLGAAARFIVTVRGIGFAFDAAESEPTKSPATGGARTPETPHRT